MRLNDIKMILEDEEMNFNTDEIDQAKLTDTRKPRLTLRILNQLKNMRVSRQKELADKAETVAKMYGGEGEE